MTRNLSKEDVCKILINLLEIIKVLQPNETGSFKSEMDLAFDEMLGDLKKQMPKSETLGDNIFSFGGELDDVENAKIALLALCGNWLSSDRKSVASIYHADPGFMISLRGAKQPLDIYSGSCIEFESGSIGFFQDGKFTIISMSKNGTLTLWPGGEFTKIKDAK